MATALKELLTKDDAKALKALVKVGMAKALSGNFPFWAEIFNRIDGRTLERMDITTAGEAFEQRPDEFYEWLALKHQNGKANGRSGRKKHSADS